MSLVHYYSIIQAAREIKTPSRNGRVVYSAVLRAARTVVGSSPEPPPILYGQVCKYVGSKSYTVSRCHNRGESEDHSSEKGYKGSTLALKPRADVTRGPKQGYQWPHEKDLCPPSAVADDLCK